MTSLASVVRYILIAAFLLVSEASYAQTATQLAYHSLIPSNQLENFAVPIILVNVEDASGNIVNGSSASVTLTLSGPGLSSPVVQTNDASSGLATFSLGTTLVSPGLYSVVATSTGLTQANQVIGVDVAMIPPQGSILTGAYVDTDLSTAPGIHPLEQTLGRTLALDTSYRFFDDPFLNAGITDPVKGDQINNRIPVVHLACKTRAGATITDNDIVTGVEDSTITTFASQVAAYGRPVVLRFMSEMNLGNQAACIGASGPNSGASGFIAAWQHIYKVFMAQKAFNVIWLFLPGANGPAPEAYYPGDSYVDIVGVDSYNLDKNSEIDPFALTFQGGIPGLNNHYTYASMAATNKPLMVGESNPEAINQISYFSLGASDLQQLFPNFIAFAIFDAPSVNNGDFSLTTSTPGGLSEYTSFVNNPYLGATYTSSLGFTTYPFNTRIHIASPVASVASGGQVSLSAEIMNDAVNPGSPIEPTGSLYIYEGSTLLATYSLPSACTTSSVTSCRIDGIEVTLSGAGATQNLTAVYSGDSNNGAGQSWPIPLAITQAPSSVTLSASANPAAQGISDTLTATVSGAGQPSGSVVFLSGSTTLCTSTLSASSVATCTFTPSASGTLSLAAQYLGDADHLASTGTLSLSDYDLAITEQFSSTQLTYPGATNVTVCVTGTTNAMPTGTVQVDAGSTTLTTFPLQGNGCGYYYISPGLNAGTYTMTAVYSGDQNNPAGSSTPVVLAVNPVPVNMSASCWNPSLLYGSNYQCTANVSSNAGSALGNIAYSYDAGAPFLIPLSNGSAQFTIAKPSVGSHSLNLSYAQQTNFSAATPQSESFTVAPTPVQVSLSPSTWYATTGTNMTFQVSVSSPSAGPPDDGEVSLYDGSALLATVPVNSNGQASYSTSSLPVGNQTITSTYAGDSNYSSGSTNIAVTIAQ